MTGAAPLVGSLPSACLLLPCRIGACRTEAVLRLQSFHIYEPLFRQECIDLIRGDKRFQSMLPFKRVMSQDDVHALVSGTSDVIAGFIPEADNRFLSDIALCFGQHNLRRLALFGVKQEVLGAVPEKNYPFVGSNGSHGNRPMVPVSSHTVPNQSQGPLDCISITTAPERLECIRFQSGLTEQYLGWRLPQQHLQSDMEACNLHEVAIPAGPYRFHFQSTAEPVWQGYFGWPYNLEAWPALARKQDLTTDDQHRAHPPQTVTTTCTSPQQK